MVTLEDVRAVALTLPRAYEALVRDYVKFRVRSIVFCSVSPDETLMGFGFPKEEREALVAARPDTFLMPVTSDLRYHWVRARMAALDPGRDGASWSWTPGGCASRSSSPPGTTRVSIRRRAVRR